MKIPPSSSDDYCYVLHNTTSKELKRTEYVNELHKYKTKCTQCKTVIQRVRSLLDEIKAIRENDVIGICDHCKQATHKNIPCKRCDFIVSKFIDIHRRRCSEREQRFKVWVCKVRHLLQALIDSESVCQHTVYKDTELERFLRELKGPLSMRVQDKDLFPSLNLEKLTSLRSLSQSKEMLEDLLFKIKHAGDKRKSDDSLYPTPSTTCRCKDGQFNEECPKLRKEIALITGDVEPEKELSKDLSKLLNKEDYKRLIKQLLELSGALPQKWHQNKEIIRALLVTLNYAINQELSKDIIYKILEQLRELKNIVVTQDFTKYIKGEVIVGLTSDFGDLLGTGSSRNLDNNLLQLMLDLTELLADELSKNVTNQQSQLLLKSVQEEIAQKLFKAKDAKQVRQEIGAKEMALSKDVPPISVKGSTKDITQGTARGSPKASPRDTTQESAKGLPKVSPRDKAQGSARARPKMSPRDTVQDSGRASPKVAPLDLSKKLPKGTAKAPIKYSPKDKKQESPKSPRAIKDFTQGSPKGPPKDSMRGAAKAPPKDPMRGAAKGPPKDLLSGAAKGPPKDTMRGAAKGPPKDPMRGAAKGPPKDPLSGAAKGPPKDSMRGADKGPPKDTMRGADKGPPKDTMRGAAKGPPKDPMHGAPKAPPKSPKQSPDKGATEQVKGTSKGASKTVSKGSPRETKKSSSPQKDSGQGSPPAVKDTTQASSRETKQTSARRPTKDPMYGAAKAPPKLPAKDIPQATKAQPKDKEQVPAKEPKEKKTKLDKSVPKDTKQTADKTTKESKPESVSEPAKEVKQKPKGPAKHPMHGAAKAPPKQPKDKIVEKPAEKPTEKPAEKVPEKSTTADKTKGTTEPKKEKGKGKDIPLAIAQEFSNGLVNKLQHLKEEYDETGDLNQGITKEINTILRKTIQCCTPEMNTNVVNELSNLCAVVKKGTKEDIEVVRNFIKECLKGLTNDEKNKKDLKALLATFTKSYSKGKRLSEEKAQSMALIQKALDNKLKEDAKKPKRKDEDDAGLESGDKVKGKSKKKTKQPKSKKNKLPKKENEKENLSPEKKAKADKSKEEKPSKPPDRIPRERHDSNAIIMRILISDKERDAERKVRKEKRLAKQKEVDKQKRARVLEEARAPPPSVETKIVVEKLSSDILACPRRQDQFKYMVQGEKVTHFDAHYKDEMDVQVEPLLFKTRLEFQDAELLDLTQANIERGSSLEFEKSYKHGIIRYRLSDRDFIEKGWTKLPTKKIMRRMNIYKMEPVNPQYDWFERHKGDKELFYDSGVRLADIDDNGRGHWYYRNGAIALDYYNAEESNIGQRYVVYSSGEENESGRVKPITVLGLFDVLGNGVVYDHCGNVRLKYNQSEGLLVDPKLGPPGRWKWHTLNDPPVLQQVFVNTRMHDRDVELIAKPDKTEDPSDSCYKHTQQEMLSIELDNFVKEKATKLLQKFKPFQIRMKAVKLNEQFSLKIFDQANINLVFRDGATSLKINLGRLLKSDEIIDTETSDMADVATPYDKKPARSGSVENIQRLLRTVRNKVRTQNDFAMKVTGQF